MNFEKIFLNDEISTFLRLLFFGPINFGDIDSRLQQNSFTFFFSIDVQGGLLLLFEGRNNLFFHP